MEAMPQRQTTFIEMLLIFAKRSDAGTRRWIRQHLNKHDESTKDLLVRWTMGATATVAAGHHNQLTIGKRRLRDAAKIIVPLWYPEYRTPPTAGDDWSDVDSPLLDAGLDPFPGVEKWIENDHTPLGPAFAAINAQCRAEHAHRMEGQREAAAKHANDRVF